METDKDYRKAFSDSVDSFTGALQSLRQLFKEEGAEPDQELKALLDSAEKLAEAAQGLAAALKADSAESKEELKTKFRRVRRLLSDPMLSERNWKDAADRLKDAANRLKEGNENA